MGPRPGVGAIVGARAKHWVSNWGFKQWRQALLALVLASTALFGGLDTVDKSVTIVKPGDEFNNGRYTVTVDRATLVRQVQAGNRVLYREKPGVRYLGVVAKVRNDSTLPGRVMDPVELRDQRESRLLEVVRLADGTSVVRLGSGLTDQIVYVWELPENAVAVGGTVTLRIWKQVKRLGYSYGDGWVPSLTDYGQVVVAVGGQS